MAFKACNVFVTDEEIFVFTESVTPRGAGISDGPYFRLDATTEDVTVGATVLQALEASIDGVPHPDDLSAVTRKILAFTGDRSWREFAQRVGGHAVVAFDGREVQITPHRRGPKHSFLVLEELTLRCGADAHAVGKAVMAMIGPGGTNRMD